jgi:hypothetical protein
VISVNETGFLSNNVYCIGDSLVVTVFRKLHNKIVIRNFCLAFILRMFFSTEHKGHLMT